MYDYILKGGNVVDGSGNASYKADVCIKDGIIAKIGKDITDSAANVIDVAGNIVSPGFIDIHSHSDSTPFSQNLCDSKLEQGVTTEIVGNCGSSALPYTEEGLKTFYTNANIKNDSLEGARFSITDYAKKVNERGYLSNIGMLIGHRQLRINVTGYDDRLPTEEEMRFMENLLDRELKRGCFGISLGLIYPPSAFSQKEELVRLAKVVAKNGGIMAVHMRNEGPKIFEAVEEVLSIAEESGVHLEISHLKLMGKSQWNKAEELIKMIEKAQEKGIKVTCDQYPFLASSTSLTAVLPHYAHDGGRAKMLERLSNPDKKLKEDIENNIEDRGGKKAILIPDAPGCPQYKNKFLNEIADELGISPTDALIKILIDSNTLARGIYFCMNENDMLNIMKKDYVSVGSDGTGNTYDKTKSSLHPRNFGTFPQFFETVREKAVMPLEAAVYKCTGLPAKVLNLTDRGILKEGNKADITVFSFEKIKNNSTYEDPRNKPDGISYVFVNGTLALKDKTVLSKSGKAILKK